MAILRLRRNQYVDITLPRHNGISEKVSHVIHPPVFHINPHPVTKYYKTTLSRYCKTTTIRTTPRWLRITEKVLKTSRAVRNSKKKIKGSTEKYDKWNRNIYIKNGQKCNTRKRLHQTNKTRNTSRHRHIMVTTM